MSQVISPESLNKPEALTSEWFWRSIRNMLYGITVRRAWPVSHTVEMGGY